MTHTPRVNGATPAGAPITASVPAPAPESPLTSPFAPGPVPAMNLSATASATVLAGASAGEPDGGQVAVMVFSLTPPQIDWPEVSSVAGHPPDVSEALGGQSAPSIPAVATSNSAAHQRRTNAALKICERDLISYLMAIPEEFGSAGAASAIARRMDLLTNRIRTMLVLDDRARGATWGDIDAGLGEPSGSSQEVFEPMEERWKEGNPAPWAPTLRDESGNPVAIEGTHPIQADRTSPVGPVWFRPIAPATTAN